MKGIGDEEERENGLMIDQSAERRCCNNYYTNMQPLFEIVIIIGCY